MLTAEQYARNFWCAAYFYRRGEHRDPGPAVKVLRHVTHYATGMVQDRAATLLKEIDHGTGTDEHAPGDN